MVENYIRYLLFEHDCVVIPEFGGFIANYVSAEIHPVRHTFVPPSKNIAFNEMLKLNDGLLVAHMANHERISRDDAQKSVKDFIAAVRDEIRTKGKYHFTEIGTLFLNHEQKLQFQPDNRVNYLSGSYGLPELHFQPIERVGSYARTKPKDRSAAPGGERVFAPRRKQDRSRIAMAVILPVLLLLATVTGYFLFLDPGDTALSSLNPFQAVIRNNEREENTSTDDSFLYLVPDSSNANATTPATKEPTDTAPDKPDSTRAETPVTTPAPQPETNPVAEAPAPAEKEPLATDTEKAAAPEGVAVPGTPPRYYVIVGGFSVEKNAYKLRRRLIKRGATEAKVILPKQATNLIKVSFVDYADWNSAAVKAGELKSDFGETVWVLKY